MLKCRWNIIRKLAHWFFDKFVLSVRIYTSYSSAEKSSKKKCYWFMCSFSQTLSYSLGLWSSESLAPLHCKCLFFGLHFSFNLCSSFFFPSHLDLGLPTFLLPSKKFVSHFCLIHSKHSRAIPTFFFQSGTEPQLLTLSQEKNLYNKTHFHLCQSVKYAFHFLRCTELVPALQIFVKNSAEFYEYPANSLSCWC